MKVIIVTLGSSGDIHPFLGIGTALKKRGHEILFLSSSNFAEQINNLGFTFKSIHTRESYDLFVERNDPDKVGTNAQLLTKYMVTEAMEASYNIIKDEYIKGNTVCVTWHHLVGVRIANEKLGVPMVTINLAPTLFRSLMRPPRVGHLHMPAWTPKFMYKIIYRLFDNIMDGYALQDINAFRAKLELPPIKRFLKWSDSPDKIIGLFPEWFAQPQPDWPQQSAVTSFPLFEGDTNPTLDQDLAAFLAAGDPPILFTPGTHFKKAHHLFTAAVTACTNLNKRGLFLTKYSEQIPKNLPPYIKHFTFADFSILLPKIALLVHHGGIGTTAQAIKAGIPQLITPWGHDQFDNALRLIQLGIADEILIKNINDSELTEKLQKLLSSKAVLLKCKEYSAKLNQHDPLAQTCQLIEHTLTKGHTI